MRPTLFTVSRTGRGQLATMARPRGGDWLTDELGDLATAGVDVLVSLLSDAEVIELDLRAEAEAARAAGIEFYRLPTPDRTVPDRAAALAMGRLLAHKLNDGLSVALHCRHGIGRSSTLAAVVLVLKGIDSQDTWTRICAARGLPVPDTSAQREFIDTLTLGI
jgi:protein tyrosine phosphatase (PTP) superfamily phosphohydrolase (DUF442 family)